MKKTRSCSIKNKDTSLMTLFRALTMLVITLVKILVTILVFNIVTNFVTYISFARVLSEDIPFLFRGPWPVSLLFHCRFISVTFPIPWKTVCCDSKTNTTCLSLSMDFSFCNGLQSALLGPNLFYYMDLAEWSVNPGLFASICLNHCSKTFFR